MHINCVLFTIAATSLTAAFSAPASTKDANRIDFFSWAMSQKKGISYAALKERKKKQFKKLSKDKITSDSIDFAAALLDKESDIAGRLQREGSPEFTFRDYFNYQEPQKDVVDGGGEKKFLNDTLVEEAIRETLKEKPFKKLYLLDASPQNIYADQETPAILKLMETTISRTAFKSAQENSKLLPMVNVYRHREHADTGRQGIERDLEAKQTCDALVCCCVVCPCAWPCLPLTCIVSWAVNLEYKYTENGALLVHLAIGLLGVMKKDISLEENSRS
jgi:hypothetical protein